jgi:hypothetical protein
MSGCPEASTFLGLESVCAPNPCLPNPNRGGFLIPHANLQLSYPNPGGYCGNSGITSCAQAVNTVTGEDPVVFYVLAAFPDSSAPRVKTVSFGVEFDDNTVGLMEWGHCGAWEMPTAGWPYSGQGVTVFWDSPQTSRLQEVYWFAAYSYEAAERVFRLVPHPQEGASFWDDQVPPHRDTAVCLGALGFNTAGSACCDPTVGISAGESAGGEELRLTVANPAVGMIAFEVDLPRASSVKASLFDVSGKCLRTLISDALPAGPHPMSLARSGESGERLAAGVYYLQVEGNGTRVTKKVVVAP